MVFRSKGDIFLLILIYLVVVTMGSIALLPLLKEASLSLLIIEATFLLMGLGFIVWYGTSIQYVFCEDSLVIKGGSFKSKILYQNIIKISPTTAGFTGFRISSSDPGLELWLQSAPLENIKIFPDEKLAFITEFRKRCPHTQIQPFE